MKRGFTVIELLIVAAVIGMIALVAIPNFEDAQHRSKVSRVHADLRTCAAALEAYAYDYGGVYPYDGYSFPPNGWAGWPSGSFNYWYLSRMLSTPVAYLPTVHIQDPFRIVAGSPGFYQFRDYRYISTEATWGDDWDSLEGSSPTSSVYLDDMTAEFGGWKMMCAGPDRNYGPPSLAFPGVAVGWPGISTQPPYSYPVSSSLIPYDPTNGTASWGDIIRSHNCANGYLNTQ
jgi:prepilin-type N-terminal cleavage/methylation domain-containing protein